MKPSRLLLTVLALVASFSLVPSSAPAASPDGVLSMTAARLAARSLAWDVARRNPLVTSVKISTCQRRAADRIFCKAVDRGSSSALRTTCIVPIRVTLVRNRPKASSTAANCDNEPLLLLRASQALEAARPLATELGGEDVRVETFARVSRTEIAVAAGWIRPAASDITKDEICATKMLASLVEPEEIAVTITESICVVPKS